MLAQKADKANTLKGYGIEDAYTKEDSDTLLNKKADKTEFEAVKAVVGDTESGLVKDVNDLKNASQELADVTTQLITDGDGNLVIGAKSDSISMGKGSSVTGEKSISIGTTDDSGKGNKVTGKQSLALGSGLEVYGSNSGAIGDPMVVAADNSYVVGNRNRIGNNNYANNDSITENNIFVIGNDNNVSGSNTFVLGSNVNTSATNAVVLGDGSVGVDNAVSVGAPGNERQIKNVAPGTEATDAATVGQVQEVAQGAYNNAVYLSNSMNKLDNRVNKVGAGAAALAALHPIDTDDKFTMGLGYGNYRSAHAMAMGMFYRPTEKIMISVGGAFGNGENMVNAGISFALDKGKGFGTSKAVMAKNIKALSAENAAIKEENAGMKKQLDAQGQEIAALKAALARLEAKIGK